MSITAISCSLSSPVSLTFTARCDMIISIDPKEICPMNKQETYDFLTQSGVKFEITEHQAVYNMAELAQIDNPHPECDAKNLFVRDDKRRQYYLITVKGDKRVDLKAFRKAQGTRPLTFASESELMDIMRLIPGAVTPLGLLNDSELRVIFYLDKDFFKEPFLIGVHPNDNTATVWLNVNDLADIIKKHGNEVIVTEISNA